MSEEGVDRLLGAPGQYCPYYDEVFQDVSERIRGHGYAAKLDLAALITWKRCGLGRWVSSLIECPDAEARGATPKALCNIDGSGPQGCACCVARLPAETRDRHGRSHAYDPENFGVLDRRGTRGLASIVRPAERR
jgi:hypothetical protein